MLLEKYGGIWLDTDTVILSGEARNFFSTNGNSEVTFFGDTEKRNVHLAVIRSIPSSRLMRLWTEYIKDKVQNFNPPKHDFWAYLGNNLVNIYS